MPLNLDIPLYLVIKDKEPKLYVPSVEECLEVLDNRRKIFIKIINFILILSIIILCVLSLYSKYSIISIRLVLWLFFSFLSYILVLKLIRKRVYTPSKHSINERSDDEKIGRFSVKEIKDIFENLKEKMKISENVKLYLEDYFYPDASMRYFTNTIKIDESWFRILDTGELSALMTHELYHIKKKNLVPLLRFKEIIKITLCVEIIIYLFPLFFIFNLNYGNFILISLYLLSIIYIYVFFISHIMKIGIIFSLSSSRAEEFLCDLSAVKYVGLCSSINLGLKMGLRDELNIMIEELVKDTIKKYDILDDDYNNILLEIDKNLDRNNLTKRGSKKTVNKVIKNLAKKYGWERNLGNKKESIKTKKKSVQKYKIDWIRYDTHIHDFRLDENELPKFICDIESNNQTILFYSDKDDQISSRDTHPTYKQRILFLYKNSDLLNINLL